MANGAAPLADREAIHGSNELRRGAATPVKDDPNLPRVLLIGDSTAMGYTLPLRRLLKDKANVHYPFENCHDTQNIIKQLDAYLGDMPWDVIHINTGIHDLTILDQNGKSIKEGETGKPRTSLEDYRINLTTIIERLKKTGATIIWCSTTPLWDGFPHRPAADVDRYNTVANEVMKAQSIPITDVHNMILKRGKPKWIDGAHYTVEGYEEIANDLLPKIEKALAARKR